MGSFERFLTAAAPKSKLNGSGKVYTPDCAHVQWQSRFAQAPQDFKCKIQQADAAEMHSGMQWLLWM